MPGKQSALIIAILILQSLSLFAQSNNPCLPLGEDWCIDAPLINPCQLNGWQGDTDPPGVTYTPGDVPDRGWCNGDYTIENNQWLSFIAQETRLELEVDISSCTNNRGIQIACYELGNANECPGQLLGCIGAQSGQNTSFVFNVQGLNVGQQYLLMIDGFAGDGCPFTLWLDAGSTQEVVAVGTTNPICPGVPSSFSLSGAGSSFGANYFIGWTTEDGNIISGENSLYPLIDQPGTYTLTIYDLTTCCWATTTVTVPEATEFPEAFATASNIDCNNVEAVLSAIGSSVDNGQYEYEYYWYNDRNVFLGLGEEFEGVTEAGTFTLIVYNLITGCTTETTVEVAIDTMPPSAAPISNGLIGCNDDVIRLDANASSNNVDYYWTGPLDFISTLRNPSVEEPGIYSLIVTGSNGCTESFNVEVGTDTIPPNLAGQSGVITCNDLSVDLLVSSGDLNVAFDWLFPDGSTSNGANVTTNLAGDYTVVATGENGCTTEMQIIVEEDIAEPEIEAGPLGDLDCLNQSVTIESNTNEANLTYSWSGPNGFSSSEQIVEIQNPGEYLLTVQGENGCESTIPVLVEENINPPEISANVTGELNCMVNEVELNGFSNDADDVFLWYGGDTIIMSSDSVLISEPGEYTLVVISENGCTSEETILVTQDLTNPLADAGPDALLTCEADEVMLDGTASVQAGNYTHEWFNSGGVSLGTALEISVQSAGAYVFVVTDTSNGCTSEDIVLVDADENLPLADPGEPGLLTCDQSTYQLDASNSSNGNNIDLSWYDENGNYISSDQILLVEDAGIYNLIVSNVENGCTAESQVMVSENIEQPIANPGLPQLLNCSNVEVVLDGSTSFGVGALQYVWTNAQGEIVGTEAILNTEDAGIYILTVIDETNKCSDTAELLVSQDIESPLAEAGEDFVITCTDTEALISASMSLGNNLEFIWLDENGNQISDQESFATDVPGNYFLTALNTENGCEDTDQVSVFVDADFPSISIMQPEQLTCEVLEVLLDGSGSEIGFEMQYEWFDENGILLSNEALLETENIGTYTFVVTELISGCSSNESIIVESNYELPVAEAGPPLTISCDVTEVQLSGAGSSEGGDFTYEWFNSNELSIGTSLSLEVTNPDTYTLIVTNTMNGCSAESEVLVVPDENIPLSEVAVSGIINCYTQEVELTNFGTTTGNNISQEWYDENGNSLGTDNSFLVSQTGVYTLEVIDLSNGCSSTASIEVLQDVSSPIADPGPAQIINCELNLVSLDGSNSSATGQNVNQNLEYRWYDESGNQIGEEAILNTEQTGVFTLEVTDPSNGCVSSEMVSVTSDLEAPISDAGPDGLLTCELNSFEMGGPYTSLGANLIYEWRNVDGEIVGNSESLITNEAGIYTLTVIDQTNACQSESVVLVDIDADFPNADAGHDATLTCFDSSQTIGGTDNDQGESIQYQWLDENGIIVGEELNLNVDLPGEYNLVVFNTDNGCSAVSTVNVLENISVPDVSIIDPEELSCANPSTILAGLSQTINSSFAWYDQNDNLISTTSDVVISQAANYTLVVTDIDNGCSNMTSVVVPANAEIPVVDLGSAELLTCDLQTTILDASNATGVGPLVFSWTDVDGNVLSNDMMLEVQEPGVYSLQLLDELNGCEISTSIIIEQDIDLPLVNIGPVAEINCYNSETTVSGIGSSEGSDYKYEWFNSSGQIISEALSFVTSVAGDYQLQITNVSNGCMVQQNVLVPENLDSPIAQIEILGPLVLNCENDGVLIDGSASYPFDNLLFEWHDQNGIVISENFQVEVFLSGNYELFITDETNGCVHQANINIEENFDLPNIEIVPPNIINCYEPTIILDATTSSQGQMYEIAWSGNGLNETTLNPEIAEAGVYTLTIVNTENGCKVTESVEVIVDLEEPISQTAVYDELDCVTASVDLDGTGSSSGNIFTYEWMGVGEIINSTSLNPTVSETGMYELMVTNVENGCTAIAPIQVRENLAQPSDAVIEFKDITCFGFNDGQIVLNEVIGGTAPYQYAFNGNEFMEDLDYSNLGPGTYTVQVLDAIGCEWETELQIVEPPLVYVDLGPDLEISLGDEINLYANSNGTYIEWESEDALDCLSNCFTQLVSPFETTTYYVEVTDENGCPDIDEIVLKVDQTRAVYIPNAFSPNKDGINDFFTVYNNPSIRKVNRMLIADRWGEIVFEARDFIPEDPANGWYGDFRKEEMNGGVFVYYAEVEFIDGFIGKYKGDVTLIY